MDLDRFVSAQSGGVHTAAVAELRAGQKLGHWMWYVFPQLRGLGQSPTAYKYGIDSLAEAQAYCRHPVLGPRLVECAHLVLAIESRTAQEIFGGIDTLKLRSSMTLFAEADPTEPVFQQVLAKYFPDGPDPATLERL